MRKFLFEVFLKEIGSRKCLKNCLVEQSCCSSLRKMGFCRQAGTWFQEKKVDNDVEIVSEPYVAPMF